LRVLKPQRICEYRFGAAKIGVFAVGGKGSGRLISILIIRALSDINDPQLQAGLVIEMILFEGADHIDRLTPS